MKNMQNDISTSPCITGKETELLRQLGIKTTDDLWKQVGADFNDGITILANSAGLNVDQLTKLLILAAEHDAEAERASWIRRNWREGIVCLGIVVLVLRAIGIIFNLPLPLALRNQVAVPTDNFKGGHVLRAGDIRLVAWTDSTRNFHDLNSLNGLILAHTVLRDKPLIQEDVLNLQVVTTTDVPSGKVLTAGMVATKWLPFDSAAETQPGKVVGHKVRCPLRKDTPIIAELVDSASFLVPQVVVRVTTGLSVGHVIRREDVDVKRLPDQPGAFTSVQDVVGRRTGEAVETGKLLLSEQLTNEITLGNANAQNVNLLRQIGVTRFEQLSHLSPDKLLFQLQRISVQKHIVTPIPALFTIENWINQAKRVKTGRIIYDAPRSPTRSPKSLNRKSTKLK